MMPMMNLIRKRRRSAVEEDLEKEFYEPYRKRRFADTNEDEEMSGWLTCVTTVQSEQKRRKKRGANKIRRGGEWWDRKYLESSPEEFKKTMRINRDTFNMILQTIQPYIQKQPTNFNQMPISPDRQLGLTLYRLGHGVTLTVLEDLFGVSEAFAGTTFMQVCKVMIAKLYKLHVKMPETEAEWEAEMGVFFLSNYEFPMASMFSSVAN